MPASESHRDSHSAPASQGSEHQNGPRFDGHHRIQGSPPEGEKEVNQGPSPAAPRGLSDAEVNQITLDPRLPAFGGGNPLFGQAVGNLAPINVMFLGSRPDHSRVIVQRG